MHFFSLFIRPLRTKVQKLLKYQEKNSYFKTNSSEFYLLRVTDKN